MSRRFIGLVVISALLFSLFSAAAAARTYEIQNDDEIEQVKALQAQKYSQGIGDYHSYYGTDDTDALRDDMYFYEVNDANRDSRLRNEVRNGFDRLAENKGAGADWSSRRELCHDWDWMYDSLYLQIDDTNDFFRLVNHCENNPAFYDSMFNYWEGSYYSYRGEFPPWVAPQDGVRVCAKAKNYQEFLQCRDTFLPHYRADAGWPAGYFGHTGSVDYGKDAYSSWADRCAAEIAAGSESNWCRERRPWIDGTVGN
ncbi:MAG: hypothetical protein Q7R76_01305 [Candidatus Woesearchaeota archaeon]|nr:hypothetical protein [Candidatus Woesearchaeota archaeon]